MKFKFLILALSLFMACQSKPVSKEKEVISVETDIKKDDNYYKCPIKTANEFGEKYLKNEIKLKDCNFCDSLLLAVVDKLSDKNIKEKPFWFAVLSKMSPETDGYLSEGFGEEAHDFIENNPIQFSKNILSVQKDFPIETNLQNWADAIKGEIRITQEGNEKTATSKYIRKIRKKMAKATAKEDSIIDSFCKKLEKTGE